MVVYVGIALISAAMLLLELALLRIFAVQQFYHFAFMAVSLALLGAGASGSWLTVARRRPPPAPLCLAFSLTTIGAYLVINYLPFDSFSIAWDSKQIVYLAIYFLAAAVPFFFVGLLVGSALMAAGETGSGSHRVYAANLIGSAAGSLGSLAALGALGGVGTVLLAVALGAAAGLLFLAQEQQRAPGKTNLALGGVLALLGVAGLLALWRPPAWLAVQLSPYKTLAVLSQTLDARHTVTAEDAKARVDVIESGSIHVLPGLSLNAPVWPPPQAGLLLDGDSLMPITGLAPDAVEAAALAAYLPGSLAYQLRPQARALVLGAGAGMDVLVGLAAGAASITAVEENGLVLDVLLGPYLTFTGGLYADPRVTLVNQTGRVYARQVSAAPLGAGYDVVTAALTDPHRPVTSGAYSLTEDYRYTVEALRDYLGALDSGGLLMVTRWLQTPPSESARAFGTIAQALADSGRDPATHLVAYRTLRTLTILAGERPFTPAEIAAVRRFLETRGFDAVYFPGIQPDELNRYNVLPTPAYHDLFVQILAAPTAVYADYYYDIRPPTDNRPFFFHTFRWRQTPEILATLGMTWQPFGGSGFFVLAALLILVALAAALFIIAPLLWRRRTSAPPPGGTPPFWRARVLAYFALLGLAFLFVEIPLAQRFILVLGQPVTALAVVIFAVLLFSGLGSMTSRRWRLSWGLGALAATAVVYPLLLEPLANLALRWPEWARIVLTVTALAPLGYLMGLPFASGLRIVERRDPALVPWAWAINGSFSVISAVLAVLLALTWGFTAVLWLGAAAYAGALLAFAAFDKTDHHKGTKAQRKIRAP